MMAAVLNWYTLIFLIGKLAMYVKRLLDIVPSAPSGIILIIVPHIPAVAQVKSIYLSTFPFELLVVLLLFHIITIQGKYCYN